VVGQPGIFTVYAEAGRHWVAGSVLYPQEDGWDTFPYSPLIAALLAPYGMLPAAVGNMLWRLTLGATFLAALGRWSRVALPGLLTARQRAALFLLVLPFAAATVLDGQAGGLVAASMLLAVAAAAEDRWRLAAAFAAMACLLKLYPVALLLLLCAAYPRRATLPMAAGLLAGLALPFALQRPGYVAAQYAEWLRFLGTSHRQTWDLNIANRDVALLFRLYVTPLPQPVYRALQLLTAGGAAALVLACRRAGWPRGRLLVTLLGLAGCWMTLFGPVVESYTYILVGPALGWLLLDSWLGSRPRWYRGVLLASWLLFTSAAVAPWFGCSIVYHRAGPHPVAGLLLLAGVLADAFGRLRAGGGWTAGVEWAPSGVPADPFPPLSHVAATGTCGPRHPICRRNR
jgi:hypothetical protein